MIAIIDYDAGNIKSVEKAFEYLGGKVFLTRDEREILSADKIVLPGVGAFGDAAEKLKQFNLVDPIKKSIAQNKPFLGICLGLQLLFKTSDEAKGAEGLGIIEGEVKKISKLPLYKVPHMGWNSIGIKNKDSRILHGIDDGSFFYFVHSYFAKVSGGCAAASCKYTDEMDVVIERGNTFACQFHPEKSAQKGLKILKNFMEI